MFMVAAIPGLLAFVFGWFAFRSRVTGVYLSIITQALTYALMLAFFRNDMGLGGNNGLTDFKDILGFPVQTNATRAALFAASAVALALGYIVARLIVTSKLGKILVSIRDAESRTRFLGYKVEHYKTFVFTVSAVMAGIAGALYVPQVGIINPSEFTPANSIEVVIWVALGGRGTLVGAAMGAGIVNFAKTVFTTGFLAPYWLFVLGAMFVLVTIFMPRGVLGAMSDIGGRIKSRIGAPKRCRRAAGGIGGERHERDCTSRRPRAADAEPALSRQRLRLLRRLPRAERAVAADRARRDARDHRPERRRQDHDDGRHHRQDATRLRRGDVRPRL